MFIRFCFALHTVLAPILEWTVREDMFKHLPDGTERLVILMVRPVHLFVIYLDRHIIHFTSQVVTVLIILAIIRSMRLIRFFYLGTCGNFRLPVDYAFATCVIKGEEDASLAGTLHQSSSM